MKFGHRAISRTIILSEAKDLASTADTLSSGDEILRFAQHDADI
jgi:hypothetical protein